ncbi:MAG: peptidylprolyl isomerase [Planctomycetota bacterium]
MVIANNSSATIVRFETPFGNIDVRLFGDATPASVDNFLDLIDLGAYADTIVTRSVPGFVIQGGGFRVNTNNLIEASPGPPVENLVPDSEGDLTGILNEPGLANVSGTIAYARSSEVDSATNQWFFNTNNNRANLDFQNGGFTVFGQVLSGIEVVNDIANLPIGDVSPLLGAFGGSFTDTPLDGLVDQNNDGFLTLDDVRIENFVTLDITRTAIASSDYSLDGLIDLDDYNLFASQFGNTLQISLLDADPILGTALDSDGNGDAIISAADYTVWRDSVTPVGAVVAAAVGVPEPATLGGVVIAVLAAGFRRPPRKNAGLG